MHTIGRIILRTAVLTAGITAIAGGTPLISGPHAPPAADTNTDRHPLTRRPPHTSRAPHTPTPTG